MQLEKNPSDYQYPISPTANPLRFELALWRAARDPQNAYEMKMVETGFARDRVDRTTTLVVSGNHSRESEAHLCPQLC